MIKAIRSSNMGGFKAPEHYYRNLFFETASKLEGISSEIDKRINSQDDSEFEPTQDQVFVGVFNSLSEDVRNSVIIETEQYFLDYYIPIIREGIVDFMLGRFRAWYQDEGIAVDVIQAVLARRPTRPADFDARVRAVSHFRTLDSAEALAAANKRVSNILAKADAAIGEINLTACVEPAEKVLAEAVLALRTEVQPLIAKGDYTTVLDKLANLRAPVDSFFDNVMVNAEDPALRQNRLAILNTLQGLFLQVADISVLQ